MAARTFPPPGFRLETRTLPHGRLRLELRPDDHWLDAVVPCRLTIDRLELALGENGETLVVDGVGNVFTHPDHRGRGLARDLLAIADEHMRERGAQASLLYGIDGFYGRLGWRPCGGERWVEVEPASVLAATARTSGWTVRPMHAGDLPAIETRYEQVARATPGAALRPSGGRVWSRLDPEQVLVVVGAGEQIAGWAWWGEGAVAERDNVARRRPDAHVLSELHATGGEPVLALLHALAEGHGPGGATSDAGLPILSGAPEGHPLRELVRSGAVAARVTDEYRPDGGAMLKALEPGVELPIGPLYQYLPDRF